MCRRPPRQGAEKSHGFIVVRVVYDDGFVVGVLARPGGGAPGGCGIALASLCLALVGMRGGSVQSGSIVGWAMHVLAARRT